jgi:hypothetical protein
LLSAFALLIDPTLGLTFLLFIAHLVLKKVLKGYYMKAVGEQSPYSHGLRYVAQQASLELNVGCFP